AGTWRRPAGRRLRRSPRARTGRTLGRGGAWRLAVGRGRSAARRRSSRRARDRRAARRGSACGARALDRRRGRAGWPDVRGSTRGASGGPSIRRVARRRGARARGESWTSPADNRHSARERSRFFEIKSRRSRRRLRGGPADEPPQLLVASISTGSHGAGFYALVLGEFTRVALDEIVLDDPPTGAVELFERLGNPLEPLGPIEPRAEIRRRRPQLLGEPTGQSCQATSLPTGLLGLDPGDRANPVYEWLAGPRLEFGQLAGDDHQRDLNEIVGVGLGESPAKVGAELEGELPTQLVPRSRFAVSHGEHQTVEVHPASIPKSARRDLSQRPTPNERTRGHPRCSLERLTVSASDPPDDELDELDHPPPPRLLPPDLSELFGAIGDATSLRKVWNPDEPPFVFDRFEAFECFIGGMGLVIEARDPELDRKVAIKLWKQSGPKAQQALLDEAKTLARLSHRNVVTVHETGRRRERVFFVMEWIDGVDGQAWMK